MDSEPAALGFEPPANIASTLNLSKVCSICGAGGRLVRTYCNRHYQKWYRNGFVDGNDSTVNVGRTVFTAALWNRWLAEFNAPPNPVAVQNVESVRNAIERSESRMLERRGRR